MHMALMKLMHFIYLAYSLDDFFLNNEFTEKDLIENAKVVWDTRPMWDHDYDFYS